MSFLKSLREKAKIHCRKIVFPEGEEERILRASAFLSSKGIVSPVLIGRKSKIIDRSKELNLSLDSTEIIDLESLSDFSHYKEQEQALREIHERKKKKISEENFFKLLHHPLYFASLLVRTGVLAGCVAGVAQPTSYVLKAAFSILGKKKGVEIVSGAFIMILPEGNKLIFADCAVSIEPTADQLADIATSSIQTAEIFLDDPPKVAMLSFSTQGSAVHPTSQKVKEAAEIARKQNPDIAIDGEIQLDAAIVPEVANKKFPDSATVGMANVLIFPNLDAGNIGYKLVQRFAKAEAIGPILQGLAYPMNDLSRGASIEDIINVAAITALQTDPNF